jgi:hypothetical protein
VARIVKDRRDIVVGVLRDVKVLGAHRGQHDLADEGAEEEGGLHRQGAEPVAADGV